MDETPYRRAYNIEIEIAFKQFDEAKYSAESKVTNVSWKQGNDRHYFPRNLHRPQARHPAGRYVRELYAHNPASPKCACPWTLAL